MFMHHSVHPTDGGANQWCRKWVFELTKRKCELIFICYFAEETSRCALITFPRVRHVV